MKPQDKYNSPISIPEASIGEYAIKHIHFPAHHKFTTTFNLRNVMLGGQKKVEFSWNTPKTIHQLIGPSGVWMTDYPVEIAQMQQAIKGIRGKVLVGGLGLGLVASLLAKRKTIKEVRVVEISREVIELVAEHIKHPKISIAFNDLFSELRTIPDGYFDYALFDIWQSDSESTFHSTVVPLYEASKGKIKHSPVNWQEDVMRTQLQWSLRSRLMFMQPEVRQFLPGTVENLPDPATPIDNIWHDRFVPFFQWKKEAQPTPAMANQAASFYTSRYGMWYFDREWKSYTEHLERTKFLYV